MFLITTKCNFKCCKEAGNDICQNMDIVKQPDIEIDNEVLIKRYIDNPITTSVVFGGLEPMDTFEDMYDFCSKFRFKYARDEDIVIYTGYYPNEIPEQLNKLKVLGNIIVKFGRFIPGTKPKLDPVLGVEIYEPQWAEKIS